MVPPGDDTAHRLVAMSEPDHGGAVVELDTELLRMGEQNLGEGTPMIDAMGDYIGRRNLFTVLLTPEATPVLNRCVEFMRLNWTLLQAMTGPNGVLGFQHQITDLWEDMFKQAMAEADPTMGERYDMDLLASFVAKGFWGTLERQLGQQEQLPADYLSEQLRYFMVDLVLGPLMATQAQV